MTTLTPRRRADLCADAQRRRCQALALALTPEELVAPSIFIRSPEQSDGPTFMLGSIDIKNAVAMEPITVVDDPSGYTFVDLTLVSRSVDAKLGSMGSRTTYSRDSIGGVR